MLRAVGIGRALFAEVPGGVASIVGGAAPLRIPEDPFWVGDDGALKGHADREMEEFRYARVV